MTKEGQLFNREDIIRMAREAHHELVTQDYPGHLGQLDPWTMRLLERFAALIASRVAAAAVEREREACARIAEEPSAMTYECTVACGGPEQTFQQRMPKHAREIAAAIRARGNT